MDWALNVDKSRGLLERATSVRETLRDVPSQSERRKILLLAKLLSLDSEPSGKEREAFLAALAERAVTYATTAFPRRFGEDEIAMAMLRAADFGRAKEILAMPEPQFGPAVGAICEKYRQSRSWAEQHLMADRPNPAESEGTYEQH